MFAEGPCPKLEVQAAGDRKFLVYGTYGLDAARFQLSSKQSSDVNAAQAFVEIGAAGLVRWPTMWDGLPKAAKGYIRGDLEIGGHYPDTLWLARIETKRGDSARLLYARQPSYYSWRTRRWKPNRKAREMATVGALAPRLPLDELCEGLGDAHFATYAAERQQTGEALVAGRCEDELHRARGGVRLASFTPGQASWQLLDAPASPLFDAIINMGLVWTSRRQAYLFAYPPYQLGDAPAYVARFDGSGWSQVDMPMPGPIVAMTATDEDSLWAVSQWRVLWRRRDGQWEHVLLPPPLFVSPVPAQLRILDAQAHGETLWIHAAYPIAVAGSERSAARGHVLYTTDAVRRPVYCDRRRAASDALSFEAPPLRGAEQPD